MHGKTPYEVLLGEPPNFANIQAIGSLCYVHTGLRLKINLALDHGSVFL